MRLVTMTKESNRDKIMKNGYKGLGQGFNKTFQELVLDKRGGIVNLKRDLVQFKLPSHRRTNIKKKYHSHLYILVMFRYTRRNLRTPRNSRVIKWMDHNIRMTKESIQGRSHSITKYKSLRPDPLELFDYQDKTEWMNLKTKRLIIMNVVFSLNKTLQL